MRRPAAGLGMVALVLAGCSHPSSTTYDAADIGRTIETSEGSVLASRIVDVTGETNAVGPVAGGAAGLVITNLILNASGLGLIGALIGAGAGHFAQQTANDREGIEYVLKMDDGRTVSLVQNREDEEEPLAYGTPVLVQISGHYTRVMADPRAERPGRDDWVDPDIGMFPAGAATSDEPIIPSVLPNEELERVGQRELR